MARTATYSITADANTMKFEAPALGKCHCGGTHKPELLSPDTGVPYLEANSQYFKAGDMVYLNSGAVTIVNTGDNVPIAGFALTDATNVSAANTQIRIMPVNCQDEYIMNLCSSSAADSDKTSVALLLGNAYDIALATITNLDASTTYTTVVNTAAQTDARVVITGIVGDSTLTSSSQYIKVYVKFLPFAMVSGDPTYQGLQFP